MTVSDTTLTPSLQVLSAEVVPPKTTRIASVIAFCRRNPLVLVGAAVVLVWIVMSIAAPLVAPYGPLTQRVQDRLHAPSPAHLFGTDALGRDILTRVIFGGRISLPVGLLVVTVALGVGGFIGAVAGFGPGWLDGLLMR